MSLADRPHLSRIAAVAILIGLAFVTWAGPVGAYRDLLDRGAQQVQSARETLARYRLVAQQGPQASPAIDEKTVLLPPVSDAQAVALLQEAVKSAATQAKIDIEGIQILALEGVAGASRVGLRVHAHGQLAGLDHLLYDIEASRPLLFVDNLSLQPRGGGVVTADPALDIQFDVSGFTARPPS